MPFRDVIGHTNIVETLRASIARGTLPHALLFAGRRGVGKRRMAMALAAAKYCSEPVDGDGCGTCSACVGARAENHADLIVIERAPGKRDISIAQIRQSADALHKSSRSGRGIFALVDGAERLTEEAQNAFLKTLEEPPRDATIVLTTTGADRLLPTTRSRCARFRFGPLSDSELATFAARRGGDLERSVPRSLARGSPGLWCELAAKPNPEARDLMLRILLARDLGPFEFAARVIDLAEWEAEEIPEPEPIELPKNLRVAPTVEAASDATETARRRLLDWLLALEWAVRDLWIVASPGNGAAPRPLVHSDRADAYRAAAATMSDGSLLAIVDAIDRARADVYSNVDRTLLLESLATRILGHGGRSVVPKH